MCNPDFSATLLPSTGRPLEIKEAVYYGKFIEGAYAMFKRDPNNLKPEPQPGDVPAPYEFIAWIHMSDFIFGPTEPRFYGLVARHHQNKTDFVLAVRGTEGRLEWWDDASFHLVPFSQVPHDAGRVAHGFDKIYSTLRVVQHPRTLGADQKALDAQELVGSFGDQLDQLHKRLEHAANRAENPAKHRPDRPYVVTGHSLGPALSTLFVIENKEKQKIDIATSCTFTSPRVGNVQFATAFNELPITSWRIVNSHYIVPRLPFRIPGILDFEQVNTEYRYSSGGEVKFSPSAGTKCRHICICSIRSSRSMPLVHSHWNPPRAREGVHDPIRQKEILRSSPMAPIEHLFVLMLENRSFDHMLGSSGIPCINIPPAGTSNSWNGTSYPVGTSPVDPMNVDPKHEFPDVVEQLCGHGATYPHGGPYPPINNSGFAANFVTSAGSTSPSDVMQVFTPDRLPVLNALAREFAVCDAWHCSLPGPTWPNRFFALGGSSAQLDHSPTTEETALWESVGGFKYQNGSVFQVSGLNWKIYAGNQLFTLAHALQGIHIWNVTPFTDFANDVANPKYPAQFTWIEPNYGRVTTDYVGGNSQHPLDGITGGEAFIKATYDALRNSPIWSSSMLVIIWDEHGGFFDHAAPPAATSPGDSAQFDGANQNAFPFNLYGPRVPAVVVSPMIPQGTVSHTVYDHTSPLATLERLFGLSPLTARDAGAADLLGLASLPAARTVNPNLISLPPAVAAAYAQIALDSLDMPVIPASRPNDPIEDDRNFPGFIYLAAKTDKELAAPAGVAAIEHVTSVRERVKRIRTRGDAHDYFVEVRTKLAARRKRTG